jgi:CheY-like chemotaxis protein
VKVLIAEDRDIDRLVVQGAIEGLGHQCVVASTGTEAWIGWSGSMTTFALLCGGR